MGGIAETDRRPSHVLPAATNTKPAKQGSAAHSQLEIAINKSLGQQRA
jgi:hypothetical protein